MDSQHRAIRALLTSMSPRRAVEYIQSFGLRSDEESTLIECDVNGLSYVQVSAKLHLSPDAIKERKRRAYSKIADEIRHRNEEAGVSPRLFLFPHFSPKQSPFISPLLGWFFVIIGP